MVKLSAIQLNSSPDIETNIARIDELLGTLDNAYEHLVVLPECCLSFGGSEKSLLNLAQEDAKLRANESIRQSLLSSLSDLAKKHRVFLVAGTIPIFVPSLNKYTNTSCVFSSAGELMTQYDKIHLFDVNVGDGNAYCESSYTQAGKAVKTVQLPFSHVGLSVCYDLRFPELYRALSKLGAEIITVPSAFTKNTGQAHWQALLQARAIENQCYVIAAAQWGMHKNGRETWGHSMIISPWGKIINCLSEGSGIITTDFKPQDITRIRQAMPVHTHNQFIVELQN